MKIIVYKKIYFFSEIIWWANIMQLIWLFHNYNQIILSIIKLSFKSQARGQPIRHVLCCDVRGDPGGEFHLVQNWKENCHHDHIPFNVKGNGNIVFSVWCAWLVCLTTIAENYFRNYIKSNRNTLYLLFSIDLEPN